MPNTPDVNKTQLVVRLERALKRQLEQEAENTGLTVTALVNRILMEELSHVQLTAQDYREIADEIEREISRRQLRG